MRSGVSTRWVFASRTTGLHPPTASREPSGLNCRWSSLTAATMMQGAWPGTVAGRPVGRRVRLSTNVTVPSMSMNASVRSSGLKSRLISPSPSPGSTPIAAGLLSSAASRLLRVCSELSSATPWRASSSERSRSSSASACAPRRCAAAATACSRALPRWLSATAPAITAKTRSEATPASTMRRRRCARSLAVRAPARKARSVALSSGSWSVAQSSVEASRAPRYSSPGSRPPASHSRAAFRRWRCRRRPCTSSSSQPRKRGHSRSRASCATSTSPSLIARRRASVSSSSTGRACSSNSSSGTRARTTASP